MKLFKLAMVIFIFIVFRSEARSPPPPKLIDFQEIKYLGVAPEPFEQFELSIKSDENEVSAIKVTIWNTEIFFKKSMLKGLSYPSDVFSGWKGYGDCDSINFSFKTGKNQKFIDSLGKTTIERDVVTFTLHRDGSITKKVLLMKNVFGSQP